MEVAKTDKQKETDEEVRKKKEIFDKKSLEETIDVIRSLVCLPMISKMTWTPHHRSLIKDFIQKENEMILCCSILTPDGDTSFGSARLTVTLNLPLGNVSLVWYFIKMNPKEHLGKKNLKESLTFGIVETNNPTSVENFFKNVFQPLLMKKTSGKDGSSTDSASLSNVMPQKKRKFLLPAPVLSNHKTLTNINRLIYLLGAEMVHRINVALNEPNLFVPEDALAFCQNAIQLQKDFETVSYISNIEELVLHWVEYVQFFAFKIGASQTQPEEGLLRQIQQNQQKINILENLTIICESDAVKTLVSFLQNEHSPFPLLFVDSCKHIKKFLEDFQESQAKLTPLLPRLQKIYESPPRAILGVANEVLQLQSEVQERLPRHVDRSVVVESFFVRLSWDIVNSCKNQLEMSFIFGETPEKEGAKPQHLQEDSSSKEKVENSDSPLEEILKCCSSWNESYTMAYEKSLQERKERICGVLPPPSSVLLPIELFRSRCEDLKFVWESKKQLARYDSTGNCVLTIRTAKAFEGVGGPELDLLEDELQQVDRVLREALQLLEDRSRTVFQLTSKSWLRYIDQFRDSIEEIEQRYQCVMVSAVQTSDTTSQGVGVVNVFRPLASRMSLYPVFFIMMDNILDTLEANFEKSERQFVFRALRVGRRRRGFSFSEMANWSFKTRNSLQEDVDLIREQKWLPHYSRLDVVYERWSNLSELLRKNINKTFVEWTESLESNYVDKLKPPIVRWKPGSEQLLETNFDKRLKAELEEAHSWINLGFDLPNKISEIYNDRKKYLQLISKVDSTVQRFNAVMKSVSKDEVRIFEIYIQLMIKSLYPAITSVNWLMSDKIGILCDKGLTIANVTEKEVAEYLSENNKIQNTLYSLSNLYFYCKSSPNLYANSEFQDDILLQREKLMTEVKSAFTVIEDTLSFLHKKLVSAESANSVQAFLQYTRKIDTLYINSLQEILKRSFLNFEGLLISRRSRPSSFLAPVFSLSITLTNNTITCYPEVEVIQETISNLKDVFIGSLAEIPCLLSRFSSVDDEIHIHKDELDDKFCVDMQMKLNNEFCFQTKKLRTTLEEWSQYRNLWEVDISDFFENYLYVEPDIQSFVNDIALLESKLKKLYDCPEQCNCGIFRLDFQLLIESLKKKCQTWKEEFLSQFYKVTQFKIKHLSSFLESTQDMLKKTPSDLKDIFSLKIEVSKCKELLLEQSAEYNMISKIFAILVEYKFTLNETDEMKLSHLRNLNTQLDCEISHYLLDLAGKQESYRKQYIIKSEEIIQKIEEIKRFYKTMLPTKSDTVPKNAICAINTLLSNIEENKKSLDINGELEILNLPPIQFTDLNMYEEDALHVREIWKLSEEWNKAWNLWSRLLIWDINSVEFQELLLTFEKRFRKLLENCLKSDDNGKIPVEKLIRYEVEESLLRSIENCKELTPLIINFQSAKLESRHWDKIKQVVKADFDEHSPSFSLQHFLNLNFVFYQHDINMIIIEAAEEMKFLESLNKIECLSKEIHIQTKYIPYLGSILTHSLKSTKGKIKEISIKVEVLVSSPYSKYYSSMIKTNKNVLKSMLSLLDIINDFQNVWVKWQSFFNVQEVREHFINLSTVFDSLTKAWKEISSMIANEIYLTKILSNDDPTKQLKEMTEELQYLNPLVEDFLFDKCLSYPRFCFLSLNDIIGVLSKVYDGESARSYLKKMFMNIDKTKQLKNSTLNCMEIIGVYSDEGEFLELNPYVSVFGEFQSWCSKLEASIETTLRNDVKQCRSAIKSSGSKMDEILKVWPFQVCIIAYMINFSLDFSKAFSKEGAPKKLLKKVSDVSQRISSVMQENVSKMFLEKLRLFVLIILQVKDQIDFLLNDPKNNINFISYQWDKETDNASVTVKPYKFAYSWEYQGLWKTIVATSSYYQMIFNVSTFLSRGYNIGIIGAEGEGKTELIKSFGYYLGRNVKSVITLSTLNLSSLHLLLLGAYQTHTWLLFEKSVMIPLPFLSVLEDSILKSCQRNIDFTGSDVKNKNFDIDVEGVTIKQDERAAVFFELNKEDSNSRIFLKNLIESCRPISFLAPPRKVIVECLLIQSGIQMPEGTSRKLCTTLQALTQSMPSAYSNLFGIYSLKNIIRIMEVLSKDSHDEKLNDVLPKSLRRYYVTQLKSPYLEIFEDVFEMMFPDFESVPLCNEKILGYIAMEVGDNFCIDDAYLREISSLYNVISNNRMVYIEDSSNCSKSKEIVLLSKAITRLSKEEPSIYKPVITEFISPHSTDNSSSSVYDYENKLEDNKADRFLLNMLINYSSSSANEVWLIFESFETTAWLEKLLSYFQGENTFLTGDNEYLMFPGHLKFIFHITTSNALNTLPCLRNIPTFCFKTNLSWKAFLLCEMKKYIGENFYSSFQTLVDLHLSKFLEILGLVNASESHLILKSMAFSAILGFYYKTLKLPCESLQNLDALLLPVFIFATIWSFGAQASFSVKDQVTDLVTRLIDTLPSQKSVYDLAVNINDGSFCLWNEFIKRCCKDKIIECGEDLFKFIFLSNIFLKNNIPVLIEGPRGSGKTKILDFISANASSEERIIRRFSYDAMFSSSFLNRVINSSLGDTDANLANETIILIDNLDCYETEDQLHETLSYMKFIYYHHQVFDEELEEYNKISKINWVCCFTTDDEVVDKDEVEDGNKMINSGFFHILKLPPFNGDTFNFMFKYLYASYLEEFEQDVNSMKAVIEESLSYVYFECMKQKGPFESPNLIERFMKGLSICNQGYLDREGFIKLFIHELWRTFYDSDLFTEDSMKTICREIINNYFCLYEVILEEDVHHVVYTQLISDDCTYSCETISNVTKQLKSSNKIYNNTYENVIIFPGFIKHVANIIRVIGIDIKGKCVKSMGGNILLIGAGGTGKKTCLRFAAKLANMQLLEMEGNKRDETKFLELISKAEQNLRLMILINVKQLSKMEYVSNLNNMNIKYSQKLTSTNISQMNLAVCASNRFEVEKLRSYLPSFFQSYVIDNYHDWSPRDYQEITTEILEELPSDCESYLLDSKKALLKVLLQIHNSFAENEFPPSKYFLFVFLVLKFIKESVTNTRKKQMYLEVNIEKYNETTVLVKDLSHQLKLQRTEVAQIQQTCGNTVLKMRNIKSEQGRLEQEISKKSAILGRQKEESLRIRELIDRDLMEPRERMNCIHKELIRVTKEDFEAIKNSLRPLPEVEDIFGIVLVFLGMEPSWNEIKKQLTNCLDFVVKVRKISVEDISNKTISYAEEHLPMNIDTSDDKFPAAAAVFHKWIIYFLKYAQLYKDYHPLKLQADSIDKDMDETHATIKTYQYDLASFTIQHKVLLTQLEEREKCLEKDEEKMKLLERKIQSAQSVMEQLSGDKDVWINSQEKLKFGERNQLGNSILKSAIVAYLGFYTFQQRRIYFEKWKAIIKENDICFNEDLNIVKLTVNLRSKVQWQRKGLKINDVCLESLAILSESPLPQIIIDPLEILRSYFEESDDYEHLQLNAKNFYEKILDSAKYGRKCYIKIYETEIPFFLRKLLNESSLFSCKRMERQVSIEGKTVAISSTFKLVIHFLSPRINIENLDLKPVVNVINLRAEETMLQKLIAFRMFETSERESMETFLRIQKEYVEKKDEITKHELSIQDLLSHFHEALSEENFVMESLQNISTTVSTFRQECSNILETMEKAANSIESYEATALKLAQLYLSFSKLGSALQRTVINFERFLTSSVDDVLMRKDRLKWGTLLESNTLILAGQGIYRSLQKEESGSVLVTIGLIIATWYESQLGSATRKLINILFSHECQNKTFVQRNPLKQWLPDERYSMLLTLSECNPFQELLNHIEMNSNLWRDWCFNEQPENAALPKQMDRIIRGISRLVLIKILRPDRFIEVSQNYVDKILRQSKKVPNILSTLVNTASNCQPNEIIILKSFRSSQGENILKKVLPVCYPVLASNANAVQVLNLTNERQNYLRYVLRDCSLKGYWLLLKYKEENRDSISFAASELEKFFKEGLNKRFRLWIYTTSDEIFSNSFFRYQTVLLPLPSLLKESLEYLFELTGENIISYYTNNAMKLHFFCLALMHIAIENRQYLLFDICSFSQHITEAHWYEVEIILREFLSGNYSDDLLNIKKIISFYASGSLTENVSNTLKTLVASYLSPERIQSVCDRIPALTHYTVPHSNDMANHLSQLEFIYKAPSTFLTFTSNTLHEHKEIGACRITEDLLSRVFTEEVCSQSFQRQFLRLEILKKNLHCLNFSDDSILSSYLNLERNFLLRVIKNISTGKLSIELMLDTLNKCTASSIRDYGILCPKRLLKNKINLLIEKANYFLRTTSQESLVQNLTLGYFTNPLSIWSFIVRKIWFENVCEEAISFQLVQQSELKNEASNAGVEILIKNLYLLGCSWDFQQQKLKPEEKSYMNPLMTKFNLAIVPLSENMMLMIDDVKAFKTPVFLDSSSTTPLFWIYLNLDERLDEERAVLRGVKILLQ